MKTPLKVRTHTLLSEKAASDLVQLFRCDEDLLARLQSFDRTRMGLYKLMLDHPELEPAIRPQFQVLNELIGALLRHPQIITAYTQYKASGGRSWDVVDPLLSQISA